MSKTTRIDFLLVNVAELPPIRWGYMVRFFARGWDYFTEPYRTEIDPPMRMEDGSEQPFDLEATLARLEQAGWAVRQWRAGEAGVSARAWRGEPQPVRTREQIVAMRRRQVARLIESHGKPEPQFTTFIDYAYEG
jgi:hypothetical protein